MNILDKSLLLVEEILSQISDSDLQKMYDNIHDLGIEGVNIHDYFLHEQQEIKITYNYPDLYNFKFSNKNSTPNFSGCFFLCNIAA